LRQRQRLHLVLADADARVFSCRQRRRLNRDRPARSVIRLLPSTLRRASGQRPQPRNLRAATVVDCVSCLKVRMR
jgi:hypothetical protein